MSSTSNGTNGGIHTDSVKLDASRSGWNQNSLNPSSVAGHISAHELGSRIHPNDPDNNSTTANPASIESSNSQPLTPIETLATMVRSLIPDQSQEVILLAADALVEIFQRQDTPIAAKVSEIESLLSVKIERDTLADIQTVALRVEIEDGEQESKTDEAYAVEFEDETEKVKEIDAAVDPIEDGADFGEPLDPKLSEETATTFEFADAETTQIPLLAIKADFLFQRLRQLEPEKPEEEIRSQVKHVSKTLALEELSSEEVQNQLQKLFGYQHLEFVKLCVANRWRFVFGPRLVVDRKKAISDIEAMGLTELLLEIKKRAHSHSGAETPSNKRLKKDEKPLPEQAIAAKGGQINGSEDSQNENPSVTMPLVEVDLSAFVFDQGHELLSSTKVTLPKGSFQENSRLYDTVTVPAPQPPPPPTAEDLVPITSLPTWAQIAFPDSETTLLNRIQSAVYPHVFLSDGNALLCAPTGAGKTNVAMLAMLRVLTNHRDENAEPARFSSNFKMVYIAPLKALVAEQTREFERRLSSFGLSVREFTGDSSLSQQEMAATHVLVTTPEKWDVATRKQSAFAAQVRLIVLDEVHLLHDERGPVLESIVVRANRAEVPPRLVALLATLPNFGDVAEFLHVPKSGLFVFDASYRPCPMEQRFVGVKDTKAVKKVAAMNEACYDSVAESIRQRHQVIVFVHLRKETVKTARWLAEKCKQEHLKVLRGGEGGGSAEILRQEAEDATDKAVALLLPLGFGVHHAGLSRKDRSTTEDLFAAGHVQVLVSTATLAWGVNLPAHTVVVKGTDTYNAEKGRWENLLPQDILQMLGRAGRPRYDRSGVGVVITSHDQLQYYLAVTNQQLPIESQLMLRVLDSVNAEVSGGDNLALRSDVLRWLHQTYMAVRMAKQPGLYRVGGDEETAVDAQRIDQHLLSIAHSVLLKLHTLLCVVYDVESGTAGPTELGRIAARFYIHPRTAHMYNTSLRPWMGDTDLLRVFARLGEFEHLAVRREETMEMEKLAAKCPIPLKDPPDTAPAKVGVLLQAYIGGLVLDGFALAADMVHVTQSAGRLLRALLELCLRRRWASAAHLLLVWCQMVSRRMWAAGSPLQQFGSSAPAEIVKAANALHLPFLSYFDLSPAELAEALNVKGSLARLAELMAQFPRVDVAAAAQPVAPGIVRIAVSVTPRWRWNPSIHRLLEPFLVMIEDGDGEKILHDEIVSVRRGMTDFTVDCVVDLQKPLPLVLFATVTSERWLRSLWRVPVRLDDVRMPKTPGRLPEVSLDSLAARIPVAAVKLQSVFAFSHFNGLQLRCFHAVHETDASVLVGAPKGAGKTAVAELAIVAAFRRGKLRIVYLQANEDVLQRLAVKWSGRNNKPGSFASIFATNPDSEVATSAPVVGVLSGDSTEDSRVVSRLHIVLATPEQYDAVARRWRQRKAVQAVDLVVADDVHEVGNPGGAGSTYEAVLSRVRIMAAHTQRPVRIVALSAPLLYAREFGDWLGIEKDNVLTFKGRCLARELRLEPSSGDYADLTTMKDFLTREENGKNRIDEGKTGQLNVKTSEVARGAPAVIVVSSRKAAVLVAAGLVQAGFGRISPDSGSDLVSDKTVARLLNESVALYLDDMTDADRRVVESRWTLWNFVVVSLKAAAYCPQSMRVVVFGSTHETSGSHYRLGEFLDAVGICETGGSVLAIVQSPRIAYFSRFLTAGVPVESHLPESAQDVFLREVAAGTFSSKQDCVDWLTYTWFYRRLTQNPGFYGLTNVSHEGISEHFSEVVETTLEDLAESGLIEVTENDEDGSDDEDSIEALNGAQIAAHYSVAFQTMKSISSLDGSARLAKIMETVAGAEEFEDLPTEADELSISGIAASLPLKVSPNSDFSSPSVRAFVLLQAHLSRFKLSGELAAAQQHILRKVLPIVHATVDSLCGDGHLNALQAMDLSQMLIQGMWPSGSPLLQLPHIDDAMLQRAKRLNVETIYDIMLLEDDERDDLLRLPDDKLQDVADFVNKYPNIEVEYELSQKEAAIGESISITVNISRDEEMDDLEVVSARYKYCKQESWWVVVGDAKSRQLYAVRKTKVARESQLVDLEFELSVLGTHQLKVWCMCDSYVDADKEMAVEVSIVQ